MDLLLRFILEKSQRVYTKPALRMCSRLEIMNLRTTQNEALSVGLAREAVQCAFPGTRRKMITRTQIKMHVFSWKTLHTPKWVMDSGVTFSFLFLPPF